MPSGATATPSVNVIPSNSFSSLASGGMIGSSALTANAKMQLRTLGEALNSSALASDAFLIEGHTDSIGSAQYNQALSEKRAMVVKRYLVDSTGVRASRLKAEGRGETRLLDTQAPASATNRRVQVVNLQVDQ